MLDNAQFVYARRCLRHNHRVHSFALLLALKLDGFDGKSIVTNAVRHDLSKFSKEEWPLYQRYWTELDDEGRKDPAEKKAYEPGWRHHLMNNPHHAGNWGITVRDMLDEYLVEMVCDWAAMTEERTLGGENAWILSLMKWTEDALKKENWSDDQIELIKKCVEIICDFWGENI